MSEKGFESEFTLNKTPNLRVTEEEPSKNGTNLSKKVDINILKARVQAVQNKENKKNILIFTFLLIILGTLGIFFFNINYL